MVGVPSYFACIHNTEQLNHWHIIALRVFSRIIWLCLHSQHWTSGSLTYHRNEGFLSHHLTLPAFTTLNSWITDISSRVFGPWLFDTAHFILPQIGHFSFLLASEGLSNSYFYLQVVQNIILTIIIDAHDSVLLEELEHVLQVHATIPWASTWCCKQDNDHSAASKPAFSKYLLWTTTYLCHYPHNGMF